jgi:hypothetical protein
MSLQSKPPQDIATLERRYNELRDKKIAAQENLRTSSENLEELKRQARESYQTDDLDALRGKLQDMEQENQRKLTEYQEHLTNIESQLSSVEAEHMKAAKQGA